MSEKQAIRRASRIAALKAAFAYMSREGQTNLEEHLTFAISHEEGDVDLQLAKQILEAGIGNIGKIKLIVRAFASEFTYEKIAPINRSLLIMGIGEMKFLGTPPVVVINEYVELAKEFGEDKSAGFINGVLDNYRKTLGLTGSRTDKL